MKEIDISLLNTKIPSWSLTYKEGDHIEYTHKDGVFFILIKDLPDHEYNYTAEVWYHPGGADDPYTEHFDTIDDVVLLDSAIKIAHDWMLKNPSPEITE